jgi:hypothetical protein
VLDPALEVKVEKGKAFAAAFLLLAALLSQLHTLEHFFELFRAMLVEEADVAFEVDLEVHVRVALQLIAVAIFGVDPGIIALVVEPRYKDFFAEEEMIEILHGLPVDFDAELLHLQEVGFGDEIDCHLVFFAFLLFFDVFRFFWRSYWYVLGHVE